MKLKKGFKKTEIVFENDICFLKKDLYLDITEGFARKNKIIKKGIILEKLKTGIIIIDNNKLNCLTESEGNFNILKNNISEKISY